MSFAAASSSPMASSSANPQPRFTFASTSNPDDLLICEALLELKNEDRLFTPATSSSSSPSASYQMPASFVNSTKVLKVKVEPSEKISKRSRKTQKPKTPVRHRHQGAASEYQVAVCKKIYNNVTAYPTTFCHMIGAEIERTGKQVDTWFSNERSPPKENLYNEDSSIKSRKRDPGVHMRYTYAPGPHGSIRLRPHIVEHLEQGNETLEELFARCIDQYVQEEELRFQAEMQGYNQALKEYELDQMMASCKAKANSRY